MPSKPGQRKRRPLKWTPELKAALKLAFEARLTSEQIAEKIATDCQDSVGVPARTFRDWMTHPDFQAALREMRNHLVASLSDAETLYVRKEQRIAGLAQMAESARCEYEARPWLKEVRQIGRDPETGEALTLTNESFNRDAHAAFRESLNDIAKELGQRTSKVDITSAGERLQGISETIARILDDPDTTELAFAFAARIGPPAPVDPRRVRQSHHQ